MNTFLGHIVERVVGLHQTYWRVRDFDWSKAFVVMARSRLRSEFMEFGLAPIMLCEYIHAGQYWVHHELGLWFLKLS